MDSNNILTRSISTRSDIYDDWLGDVADWATNGVSNIENPTKVPEVCFFSNEDAFSQHHCEPLIKQEKSIHCGEVYNRTNDLEKHLRSFR